METELFKWGSAWPEYVPPDRVANSAEPEARGTGRAIPTIDKYAMMSKNKIY